MTRLQYSIIHTVCFLGAYVSFRNWSNMDAEILFKMLIFGWWVSVICTWIWPAPCKGCDGLNRRAIGAAALEASELIDELWAALEKERARNASLVLHVKALKSAGEALLRQFDGLRHRSEQRANNQEREG